MFARRQIDMTPPNVLAKTVEQVSKILRSPGCRLAPLSFGAYEIHGLIVPVDQPTAPSHSYHSGKTPVFVKSMEAAVAVAQSFGKERYVEARYCGLALEDPQDLLGTLTD